MQFISDGIESSPSPILHSSLSGSLGMYEEQKIGIFVPVLTFLLVSDGVHCIPLLSISMPNASFPRVYLPLPQPWSPKHKGPIRPWPPSCLTSEYGISSKRLSGHMDPRAQGILCTEGFPLSSVDLKGSGYTQFTVE